MQWPLEACRSRPRDPFVLVAAVLIKGAIRAMPMSAILPTMPKFRRTFLADKSRWMMGGDLPVQVGQAVRHVLHAIRST